MSESGERLSRAEASEPGTPGEADARRGSLDSLIAERFRRARAFMALTVEVPDEAPDFPDPDYDDCLEEPTP